MGTGAAVRAQAPRSRKLAAMLEAYKGPARLNLTEAARIAGYRSPSRQGWQQKQAWPELFAAAEEEYRSGLAVSDDELDAAIANLVRSPAHRDHYKALELTARMKGRLDPKITVQMERSDLTSQLDEMVKVLVLTRQTQLIEAGEVPAEPEQPAPAAS